MNPQPTETERCSVGFELHNSDLEEGHFRGMASVFNTMIDTFVPTIIDPGSFKNTLASPERNVLILWQHDDTAPIGTPTEMWETKHGLEIVGKISNTTQGRDALTLMRDGVVTEMSIGFDPVSFRFEEQGKDKDLVRHVDEVRLWEVSLVSFGANPKAKITEVQSALLSQVRKDFQKQKIVVAPRTALGDNGEPHIRLDSVTDFEELIGRLAHTIGLLKATEEPLRDDCVSKLRDVMHAIERIIHTETSEYNIDSARNDVILAEAELSL